MHAICLNRALFYDAATNFDNDAHMLSQYFKNRTFFFAKTEFFLSVCIIQYRKKKMNNKISFLFGKYLVVRFSTARFERFTTSDPSDRVQNVKYRHGFSSQHFHYAILKRMLSASRLRKDLSGNSVEVASRNVRRDQRNFLCIAHVIRFVNNSLCVNLAIKCSP